MKLNADEREWGEATLEYQKIDPVVGSRIIGLAEAWMDGLEEALQDGADMAEAKERVTFGLRERYADLTIEEFTEALLLVTLYWEKGEELVEAFTALERFLYLSTLAPKLVANAEVASEVDQDDV